MVSGCFWRLLPFLLIIRQYQPPSTTRGDAIQPVPSRDCLEAKATCGDWDRTTTSWDFVGTGRLVKFIPVLWKWEAGFLKWTNLILPWVYHGFTMGLPWVSIINIVSFGWFGAWSSPCKFCLRCRQADKLIPKADVDSVWGLKKVL